MKKTIIASAIAAVVAAPAAFADVSIKGQINQEFYDAGNDINSDLNSDIVFTATEDLGNGLKVKAVIAQDYDDGTVGGGSSSTSTSTSTSTLAQESVATGTTLTGSVSTTTTTTTSTPTNDQYIALSGDFGTIQAGRYEPMIEGMVVSMAATDASDALTIENAQSSATRAEGGLRYMSPNMNGFQIGVEGFASTETAGTDDFDTTAVMVSYSNGGLTVKVADEEIEGGNETTAIAVQYKMDGLTLRVVDQDSSDDTLDDTFFGATYAMGANTFGVGVVDSDTASDGDWIISAKHAMSKRTSVYVAVENDDSASDDTTLVGIQHKF